MKMIYKSREVANTTKNYNELVNKPYINSVELVGNVTPGDLNIYNQYEVDNLIASSRSVKVVTTLPTPTIPSTMYYVGPQADGNYHVYLFDSDNQKIDLGTSSIATYKSGLGIKIDANNNISFMKDYSLNADSEGYISVNTVDNLTSTDSHLALSASQGKVLDDTKEDLTNKVTSVSSTSTDDEYPSAKCLYDLVGTVADQLNAIDSGTGV